MNRDTAQGQWKQLSGKIKQKWGKLTDDDLTRAEGDREYLVGKVHERYGIAREQVEGDLENLGYGEHDEDVDLRSSDRSAGGRMDAAGYANATGSQDMEGGLSQGGNLEREDPNGRSGTDQRTGSAGDLGGRKAEGSRDAVVGDERDEEQNPTLRVESEPQQPGGAGHTLEADGARGDQSRRGSGDRRR